METEGGTDLSPDRQPACSAAPARSLQVRKTVRYLGIEVDDAIEIAEKIDIRGLLSLYQRTWSAIA